MKRAKQKILSVVLAALIFSLMPAVAPMTAYAASEIEITGFAPISAVNAGTAGSPMDTYSTAEKVSAALLKDNAVVTAYSAGGPVAWPVVSWRDTINYDPNVASTYVFTAELGAAPEGYANSGGHTAIVLVSLIDKKTVTVGAQRGSLTANTAGSAVFTVLTKRINPGTAITLNTNNVSGITLGTNATAGAGTTVTVNIDSTVSAGSYPLTLTIDGATSNSFDLVVGSEPAPVYAITLDTTGRVAFSATEGYVYNQVATLTVTVTNTGNQDTGALAITLGGASMNDFNLPAKASITNIPAGGSDTFTVRPKTGLAANLYEAFVTVSGGNNLVAGFAVLFKVGSVPPVGAPPSITLNSSLSCTAGTYYSYRLAAEGDNPVTWSVDAGSLPDGLSLLENPNGDTYLSGTPTAPGSSSFTLKATNANGSDTKEITVVVRDAPPSGTPPTGTTDTDNGGNTGGSGNGGGAGYGAAPSNPPATTPEPPTTVPIDNTATTPVDNPPVNNPLTDVKESDWFFDDVIFAYTHGLMTGTAADKFSPNTQATRGMIVTMLFRLAAPAKGANTTDFTDVPLGKYYSDAVAWAAENEIVGGMGGGRFAPDANITRQDLAVILTRYAEYKGFTLAAAREYAAFSDNNAVSDYAKAAVEICYRAGVISGKPGNLFDSKGEATRAEVAAMLHRFIIAVGGED